MQLERLIEFAEIPGISSLAWTPQGLYLIADNVSALFGIDLETFAIKSRLSLDARGHLPELAKALKPDFEASVLVSVGGRPHLLLFGSGSVPGLREVRARVDLSSGKVESDSLSELYRQIGAVTATDLNIEGAASCGEYLILANRGHAAQRFNHLAWVAADRLQATQRLELPQAPFVGVSGLEYDAERDRLWLTASTEATSSVYEDGAIGDSYLGWIDNFAARREQPLLKPDWLLRLGDIDPRFAGHKIEAVSLSPRRIYLGADNDGGCAKLFILSTDSL